MSAHSSIKLSALSLFAASAVTVASLAVSGCATGIIAPSNSISATGAVVIQGQAYGASSPITNATVKIWETDPNSSGYPTSATGAKVLASTTTGDGSTTINGSVPAAGAWSISSSYSCDSAVSGTAGPFLYVTVTGGNTGAGVNNQAVLVAPLGACATILANKATLRVTVNESSTLAAAYALGSFIYVDNTTPGSQGVYIGAPVKNNATTGSCTGTGSLMTCVAAGLSHAFANAYNLGAFVTLDGSRPTGQANPSISANPFVTGSAANANAVVPVAELNTLSNILATCVNSQGGTTTGNCGSLFALATSASGALPVDTLTAAINIAQNPTHNVGTSTATGLYQLVSTSGPFQPTLTTYPHDWSVGIFFPGTTTTFSQPQAVTLDANDNVYAPAIIAPATGGNPSAGSVTAFSSAGAQLWTTGSNTTICAPGSAATDTNGNVWIANYSSGTFCSAGTYGLYSFPQNSSGSSVAIGNSLTNASTANIQSSSWAIAVDRFNNLWYGRRSTSCGTGTGTGANTASVCVAKIPYVSANSYGAATNLQTFATAPALVNIDYIVPDANQNIWVGGYQSPSFTPLGVIPNTGTAAAPGYAGASTAAALGSAPQGMIAIDASGNAWSSGPGSSSLLNQQLYYTLTGSTLSAANTPVFGNASISASKPQGAEFDGAGRLFFASQSSSGQIWFFSPIAGANGYTSSTTSGNLVPCYLPTSSASTCVATSSTYPVGYPRSLQIDSTGSLWYAAPALTIGSSNATGTGALVQVIGTAAPAWPQLSYAKFGVTPQ